MYKTTQANTTNPTWVKIFDGLIFDLELKPNNSSTLYLTTYKDGAWQVHSSDNSGTTWTDITPSSFILTNGNLSDQSMAIEVTKQDMNYLYLVACDVDEHKLYERDMSQATSWTLIGTHDDGFGNGHGFGVSQTGSKRIFILSRGVNLIRYNQTDNVTTYLSSNTHADVEDIIFHPYNFDEVWLSTHGGVEKSTDNGDGFNPMWEGLGVAQVDNMTTSSSNPNYILCGLYHDYTQLSSTDYTEVWRPTWSKVMGGDGQQPIIDQKDNNYMWASSQGGAWRKSEDRFNSSASIKSSACYFDTQGTLNKENTEILFRNKISSGREDVFRSTDRGYTSGTHEVISNFASFYPTFNEHILIGLYSPFNDGDVLIANLIVRNKNQNDAECHLFRTENANAPASQVTWTELTIPRNDWLASVEFDPDNNNILYLCYVKPSNNSIWPDADEFFYKIDFTNPSSPSTDDWTGNLPFTYVGENSIEIINTLDDKGVFLATEFGVFYTNNSLQQNPGNEWQLVGTGLPHVTNNGLEFNWGASVLRIGKWGRGVWQLPMPCTISQTDLEINNSVQWNSNRFVDRNIVIKSGGILTINAPATVNMVSQAKIIVEPGGKLIVNGGTITNACNEKWEGIQVWGDKTQPQTEQYQGKVELYNATISHAHEAVQLWKQNDYNKTGGMIYAENTRFLNNHRAVSAYSFQNIDPVSGKELDYNATFKWCKFENDQDYINDNSFYGFVSLWDVKGVAFKACEFYAGGHGKMAIETIDAGFDVESICNGVVGINGCDPAFLDRCMFYGFDKAIYSQNTGASDLYPINIQHAYFFDNNYGCWMSGMIDLLNIKTSEFYIGNSGDNKESQMCGAFSGRGIHIQESTGFFIENNEFSKMSGASASDDIIGIVALSNRSNHDIIYKNTFNDLKIGNTAVDNNREILNSVGIDYQCNENFDNIYADFEVVGDVSPEAKINPTLGHINLSAHNRFSTNVQWHWRNMGEEYETYYMHPSEENTAYEPVSLKVETYLPGRFIKTNFTTNTNGCPDNDGILIEQLTLSPEQQSELELQYAIADNEYEAVKVIYDDLKDGGDTPGTGLTIDAAQPDDTWELRDNLLGKSPYLSREILEKAANKTEVLPNSVLMDILSANPDELKDPDFIHFLEEKEEPLPGYMIDILMDVSAGTTYKTALLNQMAVQKHKQYSAAKKITNSLINTDQPDNASIKTWLAAMKSLATDVQIAAILIKEENYTDANSLLEMLPVLYELEGDAYDLYLDDKYILELKSTLQQDGRNYMQLDSTEVIQLEIIAENPAGMARSSARAILESFYGYDNYCDCIEQGQNKSTTINNQGWGRKTESPLEVSVSPNPATH
ncbi:MAG: hypothetical protein PHQ69_09675, partial [Bacteroidales bacterium]|nr:hypothetical protein [Bacteroidales bacterium]